MILSDYRVRRLSLAALAAACLLPIATYAQDACKSRGELDPLYCDEDGDLTAATQRR